VAILHIFPCFGIFCQEKSGNPALHRCWQTGWHCEQAQFIGFADNGSTQHIRTTSASPEKESLNTQSRQMSDINFVDNKTDRRGRLDIYGGLLRVFIRFAYQKYQKCGYILDVHGVELNFGIFY
jgi:hypothetical protein